MRIPISVLIGVGLAGLMSWTIFSSFHTRTPYVLLLVIILFAAANLGTFWMLYMTVRHEQRPLPFILLAFLPYAFLWYYFDRVRRGNHRTRPNTA